MTNPPLVSVAMSVYNGEKYLRGSVLSILNQTFRDFEFIIINDGSTDNTREILKSFSDEDSRIVLIHHENIGLTQSLNKGISVSKGKYIARQDADDISMPERLFKQVSFMEMNPTVGLLSTCFEFIDECGKKIRPCYLAIDNETLKKRLMHINQFCHGASMIRKAALDFVGVYRNFFRYAQDYDLWLRISEKYEVSNLPDFLYLYREFANAISSRKLVKQSQFAGVAVEMAKQRMKFGIDDIDLGKVPTLPSIEELPAELRNYTLNLLAQQISKTS